MWTPRSASSALFLWSVVNFGDIGRWLTGKSKAPDGFEVSGDDPLASQHAFLSQMLETWPKNWSFYGNKSLRDGETEAFLQAADEEQRRRLILAIAHRLKETEGREDHFQRWPARQTLGYLLNWLINTRPGLQEPEVIALAAWMGGGPGAIYYGDPHYPVIGTIKAAESLAAHKPPSEPLRKALTAMSAALRRNERVRDNRLAADRIDALIGAVPTLPIQPGEAWADAALAELATLPPASVTGWGELLRHCSAATTGKPTGKWSKEAQQLLKEAVSFGEFKEHVLRWFPLVDKPRTQPPAGLHPALRDNFLNHISDAHADLLKGLAWLSGLREDKELARALTALALTSYKKLPGIGPRLTKVGNACISALGAMPGMDAAGQLAVLKVKVKFGTAQKEIEKALASTAQRLGLPASELDEMGVPAYGLERVGELEVPLGEHTALLRVEGNTAHLEWRKADGKKSVTIPAVVKRDFAEDLKELRASVKDIERMLPAQRERLDNLFLKRKVWSFDVWRERYLDHPLVGTIVRRLIWRFTTEDRTRAGIFVDGQLVGHENQPLTDLNPATKVELWHPLDQAQDEILAWRDWLEQHRVQQPFKQGHREVYLLTDAERNTRVYSNRFAAHLLKQHQFNALCGARGWKNKLRLMVDDTYPPASLSLPEWNLRAEYWIEGAGDEYGRDTTDSGAYHYLTTDQVRFYLLDAAQRTAHAGGGGYNMGWRGGTDEPVPLEDIPPLVLSEVMRDVDLFVGVASVGNDPNWADGGPQGRYRDYWQGYAFGDLSGTAKTRRETLERLLPRLKIADRATLSDRFLVVRGDLRTYKIHLGSGNILMTPNDTYLCIVSKSTDDKTSVFLPFEGDRILSIVLSKAFMLAADTKITDPTIVSQIRR